MNNNLLTQKEKLEIEISTGLQLLNSLTIKDKRALDTRKYEDLIIDKILDWDKLERQTRRNKR